MLAQRAIANQHVLRGKAFFGFWAMVLEDYETKGSPCMTLDDYSQHQI